MVAINIPELMKIATTLETSSQALNQIRQTLESALSSSAVDDYFQIFIVQARVNEAIERLRRIVEKGERKNRRESQIK